MGRRVGSFMNPHTQDKDWFEVDTAKNIKLSPMRVNQRKNQENSQTIVEFRLDNIDMLKVITMTAQCEYDRKIYRSDAQQVDELEFANHLAEAVYAEETIDAADFMVEMKENALEDLRGKFLADGILTGETNLKGAGFVYSKGKKVMTIDEMYIKVNEYSNLDIEIRKCVGPITLSNLIEPEIAFFSMDYEFRIENFEITDEVDGKIKSYELSVENVLICEAEEEVFFKPFSLDTENDEIIDEFVINRNEMLDNLLEDDNSFDDRFADIF